MDLKYKSLAKDTIIFAIGSLGSKLILFFLIPLYTNFLTTDEYGIADLVSTFTQILVPFSAVVINHAVLRFGMKRSENPENVVKVAFLVLMLSIPITPVLSLLAGMYQPVSDWKWYLAALVVLTNISEVERSYLKVKNRNRAYACISILQTLVLAISNIVLLTVFRMGIQGYLLANIIALLCTTIVIFIVADLQRDLRIGKFDHSLAREMLTYSIPLIFSNVSWWIIHSSDKIMIEWMIGTSVLGVYTVATKIPSLINVIIGIFNQAWGLSSFREIDATNDSHFYTNVFNAFCTFLFGVCIIFIMIIKPFMKIYVGFDFINAWKYVPLLLVASVFYCISTFIGTLYAALRKTKNDMWTSLLCALINLVVNYIGIHIVGVWGAIIGTVAAYFLISTMRLFDIRKYKVLEIDGNRYWLNTILILGQSLFVSMDIQIYLVSIVTTIMYALINHRELKRLKRIIASEVSKAIRRKN